jgi:hypothetical protein
MPTADTDVPGVIKTSWDRSRMPVSMTIRVRANAIMALTAPPPPPREHDEVTPVLAKCGESARQRPAMDSSILVTQGEPDRFSGRPDRFSGRR